MGAASALLVAAALAAAAATASAAAAATASAAAAATALEAAAPDPSPRADLPPFELDEVIKGSFAASGIGPTQWITKADRDYLLLLDSSSGDLVQLDLSSNDQTSLVPASVQAEDGRGVNKGSWQFSEDGTYLLWSYNVQAGFRHSTIARYAVLDLNSRSWSELHDSKLLHYATWAPTGHALAYVHENDIYYVPDVADVSKRTRITEDGEEGVVYNGVPDWVYEEEVLSAGSAMWFSPDGKYLAFAKFNDINVKSFKYIMYRWGKYTEEEELRYPKPGEENPEVSLWVKSLTDNTDPSPIPSPFTTEEYILQNVAWARAGLLVVTWLNRIQNKLRMSFSQPAGDAGWADAAENFQDSEEAGWIDVGSPVDPFETGSEGGFAVAALLPEEVPALNESYGRLRHPRIIVSGVLAPQRLVSDASVATAIYRWNRETGYIYYQAAPADLPAQRHVFAVKTTGDADPVCLTCSMTQPDGEQCLYASAAFSPRTQYAVVTCSGPGPALVVAVEVQEDSLTLNPPVRVMQNNAVLRERLQTRLQPDVVTNITVSLAGGFEAQVRLWLPPDLDENEKCPMIVYVYGGPGSQQVSEAYSVGWGHYLSTSRRVVYAAIDGRGSGGQGNRRLFALYRQLGTVEVEDQIAVARALAEMLPYVDGERVGIWGWSYGGYATAMAMARDDSGVFACGASVAPVTDWELYDSIYTERYMQKPEDNKNGYENANVSNKITNFGTHRFFLLHGNADDNVHYQQAMRLARALEERDILFQQQSYPDENHRIASVLTHVYKSMSDFFERCFEKNEDDDDGGGGGGGGGGGDDDGAASSLSPLPLLLLLVLPLLKASLYVY